MEDAFFLATPLDCKFAWTWPERVEEQINEVKASRCVAEDSSKVIPSCESSIPCLYLTMLLVSLHSKGEGQLRLGLRTLCYYHPGIFVPPKLQKIHQITDGRNSEIWTLYLWQEDCNLLPTFYGVLPAFFFYVLVSPPTSCKYLSSNHRWPEFRNFYLYFGQEDWNSLPTFKKLLPCFSCLFFRGILYLKLESWSRGRVTSDWGWLRIHQSVVSKSAWLQSYQTKRCSSPPWCAVSALNRPLVPWVPDRWRRWQVVSTNGSWEKVPRRKAALAQPCSSQVQRAHFVWLLRSNTD